MRFVSKKLFTGSVLALGFVLGGCSLLEDDKDEGLKVSALTDLTVTYGDSIKFDGKATGGTAPYTYEWFGTYGGDTAVIDSVAILAGVANAEETPDGIQVWVEVTDSKGNKAVSNKAKLTIQFKATGDTLTLGAQGNLGVGSVLDLDSGKVWSSATANLNQAKIDLVFLYYGAVGDSAASLNGALAAKDSGVKYGINLTNTYTTAKNIQFVKVASKPTSVSVATEAYATGTKLRSARVVAGDKFVVLSTEGRYYFIEVKTVANGRTGTAKVEFVAGEIVQD